ncbi:uncharacterized protein LOC123683184 [Harmonia axyridis]|uniref:uncharacterized protein LOC123683184 n=1 Tax=Harmonia axyridis TaxID=115357 RepID=UPI001E2778C7|nr:uncharacterized protein LOC123683184 [Harmonia axyridis]
MRRINRLVYRTVQDGTRKKLIEVIKRLFKIVTILGNNSHGFGPGYGKRIRLCDELLAMYTVHNTCGIDKLKDIIFFGTAVHYTHHIDLANRLLDLVCNINARDYAGRIILHLLKKTSDEPESYLKLAELLIKRGIDLNAVDRNEQSPLETAVLREDFDFTILLLRNGANLNSNHCQTVAHCALKRRNLACFYAIVKFCLVEDLQGKKVDDKVMDFIRNDSNSVHYEFCLNAINLLKHRIVYTKVMLHDILKAPKRTAVKYLRNNYVLLGVNRYIMEYSEFSYDIMKVRDEALMRINLEDSSIEKFRSLFGLPRECSEVILSHLKDDDLKNFLIAWKH